MSADTRMDGMSGSSGSPVNIYLTRSDEPRLHVARRAVLAVSLVAVLVILGWELAFDINDPTIPVFRELIFTAGSLFGLSAFVLELMRD